MGTLLKSNKMYIHFPYCRHLCNYCDFHKNVLQPGENFSEYAEYLNSSWMELKKNIDSNLIVESLETLYIGGGTPSLWGTHGPNQLGNFFTKNEIALEKNCEFTLEINPGGWTDEVLNEWMNFGVNRFSIGLQTLNEAVFPYLDRVHSLADSRDTLKYFKKLGTNFSVDFMLGLPTSEEVGRNISDELDEVLSFEPSHISLYILTVGQNYKHFDLLPSEEYVSMEYIEVANKLKNAGFEHYEVSNYGLPGKYSKHNFAYWDCENVLALGPSATGFLKTSGESALRYKWNPSLKVANTKEVLDLEKLKLEELYLGLRTNRGIDLSEFYSGTRLSQSLDVVKKWQDRGFAEISQNRVILGSEGFLILESLLDELFLIEKNQ